ncbi:MAG: hypothetical protein Q7S21_07230 [archaeon]|nr:hypothetical protein [archaeon]
MKLELLNKKENPMIARTEMDFEVRDAKTTPSIKDLRQNIASVAGTKVDLTIVSIARHVFGSNIVRGKARVYRDEKVMKTIEAKYMLEKNFGKPKKEETVEAVPAPAPAAAAK